MESASAGDSELHGEKDLRFLSKLRPRYPLWSGDLGGGDGCTLLVSKWDLGYRGRKSGVKAVQSYIREDSFEGRLSIPIFSGGCFLAS